MSNKLFVILLILTVLSISLNGEIINITKLNTNKPFTYKRDLFSPKRTRKEFIKDKLLMKKEQNKINEKKLMRKHEEVFDKIIYEGYVLKNNRKIALLSINGEFVTCTEKETILDKIKIISISSKTLMIKIENKKYDINLKENEDEEQ